MEKVYSKKYKNDELFNEALFNSREAYEISRKSTYFRTPKVLSSYPDQLTIDFEFMEGWLEFTSLIRSYSYMGLPIQDLMQLFAKIGRGLAEYHKYSQKKHGDFDSTNVLFKIGESKICFIDFSRPNFADHATYNIEGNIYRDLALFIIYLRIKYPPNKLHFAFREKNRKLSKAVLKGYCEEAEISFDYNEFHREYLYCLRYKHLSGTFISRFFKWSQIFQLEDIRECTK